MGDDAAYGKGLLGPGRVESEGLGDDVDFGDCLYRGDEYSVYLLKTGTPQAQDLLDRSCRVAWSQRPDLTAHVAGLAREHGIGSLVVPAQRSARDAAAFAEALEAAGVEVIDFSEDPGADGGALSDEDADEVARRLRDLGYL